MEASTNQTSNEDLIVHDPSGTLFSWIWAAVCGLIPLYVLLNGAFSSFVVTGAICFPLAYFFFLVARVKTQGVVVKNKEKLITYPGGSIAAESIMSFVSISYWLQATKSHSTKFSDISQISMKEDTTVFHKIRDMFKNKTEYLKPHYRYGVQINGNFGSALIYFRNRQKADQLFSVLRQNLNAGVPYFDTTQ
jgi:hypothetical protein